MIIRQSLLAFLFVLGSMFTSGVWAQDKQAEYKLGPGDGIRIQVFQNPDLTLETRVTESGTITFPLIGVVRVGGMPVADAEQSIAKALRDGKYIQKPNVTIAVLHMRGSQVAVLGHVNRPGRFPLETVNVKVSDMLALAGGTTPTGADVAIVTGTRDGKPFRREIDIAGLYLNKSVPDDLVVAGGDMIYVHRSPVFYIYGEVQRPGAYRVERGMTIRQALAQGGGPTARGTERRLGIYRRGANQEARADLSEAVQSDDVYYVRESWF